MCPHAKNQCLILPHPTNSYSLWKDLFHLPQAALCAIRHSFRKCDLSDFVSWRHPWQAALSDTAPVPVMTSCNVVHKKSHAWMHAVDKMRLPSTQRFSLWRSTIEEFNLKSEHSCYPEQLFFFLKKSWNYSLKAKHCNRRRGRKKEEEEEEVRIYTPPNT